MDYHKCIVCSKVWVLEKLAKKQKEWAKVMHQRYSKTKYWRCVRFSDEVHWSVRPKDKCKIIRKPGERYCSDCIQHYLNWEDKKVNVWQHSWVAIGYNFKSDLNFHTTKSCNGKMSLKVYRDQILEPIVKP
jgi:predicted nucleic acid-binding Zn ribbon protein